VKRLFLSGAACALALLAARPAQAQLNGSHVLGDFGVQSGSQPLPGVYAAFFVYRYHTDTIKGPDGQTIQPAPGDPASIAFSAAAPMLWYVSKAKVFGANYGAIVILPWANGSLEAPAFGLGDTIDTGFSDMLVRPIDLGWHTKHADVAAGYQIYFPTGEYEQGGSNNTGKGMWTQEPFVGTTVYFDKGRTVSFATTAYWEFHGEKKDTKAKVGQILTLEGGAGKSFLKGGVVVGAAYYAQWKLTEDRLGEIAPGGTTFPLNIPFKHKVFAFGPDVTLPVASKSKLFALVNFRYLWETGAHAKTQGETLIVAATFPVPSVKLK
jgi:hypothetical protein